MAELPISVEMITFATHVARATHQDKLEWETTADADVLLAPVGGQYTARLERVTRLDRDGDQYETYELALLKAREELFRLDGDMLDETSFSRNAQVAHDSWTTFRATWSRALMKAKKLTDDLKVVNSFLSARLGTPPALDDDDEVPF